MVLLEREENFANAIFYVIKNKVTNIISEDLTIQLGLLTLHNKTTYKVNSQALSTKYIILDNDSNNKVTEKLLNKYHKVLKGVGKYNKDQVHLFINDEVPPVAQKARHISYKMREKLEMLRKQDIVEDVKDEPNPWISPIAEVPKNHYKTKIRLCIDM